MSKKFIRMYSLIIVVSLIVSGCSFKQTRGNNNDLGIKRITSEEAKEIIDSGEKVTIIDVREENEYSEGHIRNSILVPLGKIESNIDNIVKDKEEPILVYCRSGRRSAEAASKLNELGYKKVYDFGGIIEWKYDIEK